MYSDLLIRSKLYSFAITQSKVYNRSGSQHSILYRTYDWGIGNDFHSLSIFCRGRVLSLTQLHTLQHRQELLLLFHFELFQKFIKVCTHWKILSSVLIYLYRSWCSMCKQLHRGLSLKNSFQILLYALQKILHYFWSTICHSHIFIRNAVVLPLTFL